MAESMDACVELRPARESELERILAMYRASVGGEFCTWDEEYPDRRELRADFSADCLYAAFADGTLVGAVSVVPENELDGFDCWQVTDGAQRELARVVVSPEQRGKGYAAALVSGALTLLRESGCSAVHLAAAEVNLPALAVYRKLGFDFRGSAEMYGARYFLCEKRL